MADLFEKYGIQDKPDPREKMVREMSTLERGLVGLGRGVASTAQGIKQGYMHLTGAPGAAEYDRKIADEAALFQTHLGDSPAAGIGNVAGQVAATAPLMLAPGGQATVAGRLGMLGGLGAAGSMTQPVTSGGDYATAKLSQGMLGGATGAGVGGAIEAGRALLPNNIMAGFVNTMQRRALRAPFGQEGLEVAQEAGMDLTPAMVSGSRAATMAENVARQSMLTMDKVLDVDKKLAEQAIKRTTRIMDSLGAESKSAASVGSQLRTSMNNAVRKIAADRKRAAAVDYGRVRQLAGDGPVIDFPNTIQAAQEIASEYRGVPGADARKVMSQITDIMKNLGANVDDATGAIGTRPVTIDQALNARQYFSKASKGGGRVFDDVSPALDRRIAAKIAAAMEQDFDIAGGDDAIGAALKAANKRYREFSRAIESVELSPLGKLLGREYGDDAIAHLQANTVDPERLANAVVKMTPTEAATTRKLLETYAPDALQTARRHILEQAMERGMEIPAHMGANAPRLIPEKMVNKLPRTEAMEAWFDRKELYQIDRLTNALRRWADKSGYNFSGTGAWTEAANMINTMWNASKQAVASTAGRALGARAIADAMADPGGREALMKMALYGPKSKAAQRAVGYISALVAENESTASTEGSSQ